MCAMDLRGKFIPSLPPVIVKLSNEDFENLESALKKIMKIKEEDKRMGRPPLLLRDGPEGPKHPSREYLRKQAEWNRILMASGMLPRPRVLRLNLSNNLIQLSNEVAPILLPNDVRQPALIANDAQRGNCDEVYSLVVNAQQGRNEAHPRISISIRKHNTRSHALVASCRPSWPHLPARSSLPIVASSEADEEENKSGMLRSPLRSRL